MTGPLDRAGVIPGIHCIFPHDGLSLFLRYPCSREWSGWYGCDINGIFDPTYDLKADKHAWKEQEQANEQWQAEQRCAQQAQATGAQVLLLGMQMPPNYGPDMARQFEAAYAQVAKSQKAALVPFFLKGIGDDPEPLKWFQADRIHPNEAAQPRMLANVWPTLKKQLK